MLSFMYYCNTSHTSQATTTSWLLYVHSYRSLAAYELLLILNTPAGLVPSCVLAAININSICYIGRSINYKLLLVRSRTKHSIDNAKEL